MAEYDYLRTKTYDSLVQQCLDDITQDIDKRQGSIIFDSVAPTCVIATNLYIELLMYYINTDIFNAKGAYLTRRCSGFGVDRYLATYAERKITLTYNDNRPYTINLGERFSTISETSPIFYTVTSKMSDGVYVATCETIGTVGNEYIGDLLPVRNLVDLGNAYMDDVTTPARDDEEDEPLRERTLEWLRRKPYGGNVSHYKTWAKEIKSVGAVQVYPTWDGGGSVKLSILDPEYNLVIDSFIQQVKELFDPIASQGNGLGIAPIGHTVTVVTPTEVVFNITADLLLEQGYEISQVQTSVENAVKNYLLEIRKNWDKNDILNNYSSAVYLSRLISAILDVDKVLNVKNCKINGTELDVVLTQSGTTQQVPKLGTVVLTRVLT